MNHLVKRRVNYVLSELGQIAFLAKDILLSIFTFKVVWRDLLYQIYSIGVKSQSVVIITGVTAVGTQLSTTFVNLSGNLK